MICCPVPLRFCQVACWATWPCTEFLLSLGGKERNSRASSDSL